MLLTTSLLVVAAAISVELELYPCPDPDVMARLSYDIQESSSVSVRGSTRSTGWVRSQHDSCLQQQTSRAAEPDFA